MNKIFINDIENLLVDYSIIHYQYSSLYCIIYENQHISSSNNRKIINNNTSSLNRIVDNLEKKLEEIKNKITSHLKGKENEDNINYFLNKYDDNVNIMVDFMGGLIITNYAYDLLTDIKEANNIIN